MRIVSLLPSATEIVYALGLEDDLVGVTFECTAPPAARVDKAIIVGGRDTSAMRPGEIDAYVRARVAAGEDLYILDTGALADLSPELIITQDLCRVCALPSGDVQNALDHLGCSGDVLSLDPHSLDDVLASIQEVAARCGVPERGVALVAGLRARLGIVREVVAGRPRPRVAVIEWIDPPFGAGHWIPDLIVAAGGEAVLAHPGERSAATTWDAVRASKPDVVLVAPCGFGLAGALAQAEVVAANLTTTPIWGIDADAFVVRPGPRLVDGVEAIAWMLHPEAVPAPRDEMIAQLGRTVGHARV